MDTLAMVKAHPERYEQAWRDAGYSHTQVATALTAITTVGLTVTDGIRGTHDHPRPLSLHIGGVEIQPERPPRSLG
jgi:hypothetical protein